ncbi:MAG: SHOCT domain-containing protein [Spirochaetales bacterium]|nr:SHOCT domain-containing protein [Spirochaetales bacterium]
MKKNHLNTALLIIGISIVILGAVLFFTVPAEIKDSFREMHANSFVLKNGEWHFGPGRDSFPVAHGHGGIWVFPLIILTLILVTVIGRRSASNFFGHRRPGYMKNPMDTLRSSYADGSITREEYLERKKVFEQEKEV